MEDDNNMEVIKKVLDCLRDNPSDFVLSFEKDSFKGYCKRWCEQKKIGKVWNETEALIFTLHFPDDFYRKLRQICSVDFDFYMKALSSIDVPYILRDILMMRINADGGWDAILKVLKLSTTCKTQEGILVDDIDSILAPVALDVLLNYVLHCVEMPSEATECTEQISEILQNRTDGFYLSYHYIKYLLWKEPRKESFSDLLGILSDGFEDEARRCFIVDDKVMVEGLEGVSDYAAREFTFTGILNTVESTDVLLNFRTLLRFIQGDERAEQLWDAFKMVYSCNSQSFFTNDFDFRLKHFDICNLVLSQKDVVGAWKEINEMAQGSLHRLSFRYYEDQAMNLRSHINFMWAVNLQMINYLCKEDKPLALIIWKEFWTDGLVYVRRFARYQVDQVYQYLCILISYYYVCFVRGKRCTEEKGTMENGVDMDEMMPHLKKIENMPILVLQSVSMLLNNGMTWQDIMGEKHVDFFVELFNRAKELSVGQNKYEWVSRYLEANKFWQKGDSNVCPSDSSQYSYHLPGIR